MLDPAYWQGLGKCVFVKKTGRYLSQISIETLFYWGKRAVIPEIFGLQCNSPQFLSVHVSMCVKKRLFERKNRWNILKIYYLLMNSAVMLE